MRGQDVRGGGFFESFIYDVRHGIRSLRAAPGFTAVVVATLALAIGVGTAIFSVVDAVILRGLPYDEHDRLAAVLSLDTRNAVTFGGGRSTIQTFLDLQRLQRSFDQVALADNAFFQIRNERDEPARAQALRVSAEFFAVLRTRAFLGRLLTSDDHRPGQARVVILSHRYWTQRFAGDFSIIGGALDLNGEPWRIVGVLPPTFTYPPAAREPTDVYVPHEVRTQDRVRGKSKNYNGIVIGRLKPGATFSSAEAEMNVIAEALDREYPEWEPGRRVDVVPLHERLVGTARPWMQLLLGSVTLLLLIACANVANLILVRASRRSREIAVRSALGASRARLARALVVESAMLSLTAGLLGLVLAYGGIQLLRAWLPEGLPRVADIAMNVRVLAVTFGVASLTGLIFGLLPGGPAAGSALIRALKEGDRRATTGQSGQRLRNGLVVAEVAVAVVLVAGAGVFVASFAKLMAIDPGFNYRNVAVLDVSFLRNPATDVDVQNWLIRAESQIADTIETISRVPGVASVAAVTGGLPLSSGYSRVSLTLPDRGLLTGNGPDAIDFRRVSPNYFQLLEIDLVRGRSFSPNDHAAAPMVVIVNESAAARYWPGRDPIGQRMIVQDKERTVVGVVRDIRQYGPEQSARQSAFVPRVQEPTNGAQLLVKTTGDMRQVVPAVKTVIWAANRNQFLPPRTITMQGLMEGLIAERRFNMAILALLGSLGLFMATAGIFSVVAYVVTERRHEIGVRLALGASPALIVVMVFRQVAILLTIGVVTGSAGAWYLSSFAEAFAFQISPADTRLLGSAVVLLVVAGMLATAIPARRAALVDPLQTLRE